jgi:hypothetical protein
MSLQIAAQHLSSQGRGNDSMLVHMSPREVNSLNAIAKAHGGQLTINPKTGLAEAGFLESLLPMVAGAGLTAISGGAINPMTAGLLMGGLGYATTGSLSKGLMMGMGAYGGAGIGEALAAQGMQAAALQPPVVPVAPVAPLPPSIMTQPPLPSVSPLTDSIVPDITQSVIASPPPMTAQSVGFPAQPVPTPSVAGAGYESALANQKAAYEGGTFMDRLGTMGEGVKTLGKEGGFSNLYNNLGGNPMSVISKVGSAISPTAAEAMKQKPPEEEKPNTDMGQRYAFSPGYVNPMPDASPMGQEQTFMNPSYRSVGNEEAKKIYGYADGGATADPAAPPVPASYTAAEPTTPISTRASAFEVPEVDSLADLARAKESQRFIDAYLNRPEPIDVQAQYNDYLQRTLNAPPVSVANSGLRAVTPSASANADDEFIFDANTQRYIPNPKRAEAEKEKAKKKVSFSNTYGSRPNPMARGQLFSMAKGGGISDAGYNLGGYSDGGRLLRGPGDGVSDSIPAVIGKRQPARLADGEFVVPARIVSELGNGSTEAGARKLYAMMDRIQKARGKTVGKGKVAKNSRSEKYLPA